MRARTLARPFQREGVGIHLGRPGRVRVEPAAWGRGLGAILDGGERIGVHLDRARTEPGGTALVGRRAELRTVEHLLAALVGWGITDATLVCEGPEVPALDGSAAPWSEDLARVGVVEGPPIAPLVPRPARVRAAGGEATVAPADRLHLAVHVDFGPGGPRGACALEVGGRRFHDRVAWARTFVLEAQIPALRAAGRGRGASAENTVVWGRGGPRGPLRSPDEPVRHKLLDLLGDLALVGRPLAARVVVHRGSHALHHALVRAILDGGSEATPGSGPRSRTSSPGPGC